MDREELEVTDNYNYLELLWLNGKYELLKSRLQRIAHNYHMENPSTPSTLRSLEAIHEEYRNEKTEDSLKKLSNLWFEADKAQRTASYLINKITQKAHERLTWDWVNLFKGDQQLAIAVLHEIGYSKISNVRALNTKRQLSSYIDDSVLHFMGLKWQFVTLPDTNERLEFLKFHYRKETWLFFVHNPDLINVENYGRNHVESSWSDLGWSDIASLSSYGGPNPDYYSYHSGGYVPEENPRLRRFAPQSQRPEPVTNEILQEALERAQETFREFRRNMQDRNRRFE